ncbi:MAG: MarR family winged helix-turn-helix transcriptional regulator [Bacteroidia bacterium]
MRLEEAIKQTKFVSQQQKAFLNLFYLSGLMKSAQARFFKQHDLSPEQYNILRILRGQYPNPANIGLLQDRMLDKMSNASRLVEKLKQKALVTREECPSDRRQVEVLITKEGLDLLTALDPSIRRFETDFKGLNEEELILLNELLGKLSDGFEKE